MRSLKERKEYLLTVPWITLVKRPKRCEDYRWSHVSLAMIYSQDDERRAALREKYRCKNKGLYRLKAKKSRKAWAHNAKSGAYCWSHLMNQIWYTEEAARMEQWQKENPPPWANKEGS